MESKTLQSIDEKLSVIIKLLAIEFVKDKPKHEQATILHNLGLNSTEIGDILGKSPHTIRAQIHQTKTKEIKVGKKN